MTRRRKSQKQELRDARARIRYLEAEVDRINADRDKLRAYFAQKFRWFVELLAEQKQPDLKWLVCDMTKKANELERWWWT